MSKQQLQPQGSTPQRDPRTMRKTRAKGREARGTVGEAGGGEKKRKKPQKVYGRNVENEGDSDGRRKNCREENVGSIFLSSISRK